MSVSFAVDDPEGFKHCFARSTGVRLHYVDEGEGPLVILLHGFPYLWYMWRHQIRALAAGGYRVVAPDIRGFGRSGSPTGSAAYDMVHCVADLVAMMEELGEASAVVIGHDLGAWVAYAAAQMRPDLFRALAMLNTPVSPREPQRPSDAWRMLAGKTGKCFYQEYFQQRGTVEAELNADIRKTLRSVHYSISGDAVGDERWRLFIDQGEVFLDTVFDPEKLPAWLPDAAMDYYVEEYSRKGFAGPLGHYRARDRNWKQTAFLDGLRLSQPALFIGGAADPAVEFFMSSYEKLESHLPELRKKILLAGVGHSAAEEQPELISGMLQAFLAEL